MGQLVEFPLESGGYIVVAASEDEPVTPGGAICGLERSELLSRSGETLEAAMGRVQPAAELIKQLLRLSEASDSLVTEFGLALSASFGAVTIAKGSDEANSKVMLRWERDGS